MSFPVAGQGCISMRRKGATVTTYAARHVRRAGASLARDAEDIYKQVEVDCLRSVCSIAALVCLTREALCCVVSSIWWTASVLVNEVLCTTFLPPPIWSRPQVTKKAVKVPVEAYAIFGVDRVRRPWLTQY